MNKIREYLLENGNIVYEDTNIIDYYDDYLKITVIKTEFCYLVRIAILCYFDRWANSGFEFEFKTEDDVINYLKSPNCIADAMQEMIFDIVEDCKWNNDYSKLNKTIDFLYDMLMGDNE